MATDKLIDGNRITDADPLQVQVMTALELSAAAISSLTTALEHISATIEGPFGQTTAALSTPVVEASDSPITLGLGGRTDTPYQGESSATEIALLKTIAGVVRPTKRTRGLLTTALAVVPIPSGSRVAIVTTSVLARVGAGSSASPSASVQEAQTITKGDATSGNFTLTFQGQTTGSIAYNASAANVVTALVAISSVGAAGVTATGGILTSSPIVVTFAAGIIDGDQPLMTVTTVDLAGGVDATSRLPTVAQTTAAVTSTGFAEANTPLAFALAATDTYLWLYGDATTGVYRVSFFS